MKDLEKRLDELVQVCHSMPWTDEGFYREWLAQTYYYVCHSTRLLALAMAHTPLTDAPFYSRLAEHITEEDHHEKLALKDLERLGGRMADYPEYGITRAFYETQYYKIGRRPKSLMGYILALEMLAVRGLDPHLAAMEKKYGAVKMTFANVHAKEDQEHVGEAWKMVQAANPEDLEEIRRNFFQSCDVYESLLKECEKRGRRRMSGAA